MSYAVPPPGAPHPTGPQMSTAERAIFAFGDVFGDSEGRRYFQDGVYFDANEEPLDQPAPAAKRAAKAAPKQEAPADAPAAGQVDAQLGAALG